MVNEMHCCFNRSGSSSQSSSPDDKEGEVQFITEFGSEAKEMATGLKKSRWHEKHVNECQSLSGEAVESWTHFACNY